VNASLLLGDFQPDLHGMAGLRQVETGRLVQRFAQLVHVRPVAKHPGAARQRVMKARVQLRAVPGTPGTVHTVDIRESCLVRGGALGRDPNPRLLIRRWWQRGR
jgi:hypothetical protein